MHLKIKAVYDKDTYRTHRYLIKEQKGVKGVLYILKDEEIPEEVTVKLQEEIEAKSG